MVEVFEPISLKIGDPALEVAFRECAARIKTAGGRALVVGGTVRDALLRREAKDLDVEVYGLTPAQLLETLSKRFKVDKVGMSFGVLKLHGLEIDLSIPRRESKSGLGHKGFQVLSDPHMSFHEAASRRDFTLNAILFDPETGEIIDPFHGIADLKAGILRHTSAKFSEDPLRVLRAMQFAGRFELEVAAETVELCKGILPEGLAAERIFDEWRKLLVRAGRPSRGLQFLRDCEWVRYFPELAALIGCEQDPHWHPEGDVWAHTLNCLDAFAAQRVGDPTEDLVVGLAVLCHDFGKPATTVVEGGRIRSPGHDVAGESPTRSFVARLTNQVSLIQEVVDLVLEHMRPQDLYDKRAGRAAVRRLASRVHRIDRLIRVARADRAGRLSETTDDFPAADWLLAQARAEQVESAAPKPILLGRHLISLGLQPGQYYSAILDACYQAQLEGHFKDETEGLPWLRNYLAARSANRADETE